MSSSDETIGPERGVGTVGTGATVKELTLCPFSKSTSIPMLRKMKKICPNVQNLEIFLNGILDHTPIFQELYSEWRHLRKLSINMDECELVSKDNLDRIFTGFETEYLEHLEYHEVFSKYTRAEKLENAAEKRFVLWIGNMTGLVQLDVLYKIPHEHRANQSNGKIIVPFTRISGLYCFNLMPNLKVRLHYLTCECCADSAGTAELLSSLDSISPFATIIQR